MHSLSISQLCLDDTGDGRRPSAVVESKKSFHQTIASRRSSHRRRSLFARRVSSKLLSGLSRARRRPRGRAICVLGASENVSSRRRATGGGVRPRSLASVSPPPPAAAASRALRLPPFQRSLLGRNLIRCDSSRVEHEALYVVAQGTSLAEASRAWRITPNRPCNHRRLEAIAFFSPFLSLIFFPLSFLFNLFHLLLMQQAKSTARWPVPVKSAARPRRSPSRTRRSSPRSVSRFFRFLFDVSSSSREPNRPVREKAALTFCFLAIVLLSSLPHRPPEKKSNQIIGPRHEAHQVQPPLRQRRRRHGQEEEPELAVEEEEREGILKERDEESKREKEFFFFLCFPFFRFLLVPLFLCVNAEFSLFFLL